MNHHAFLVKNLKFGYQAKEVLRVEDLTLPSGSISFIIGPSGIGKSTILEFLGLMSNTLLDSQNDRSEFQILGQKLDPRELWNKGNPAIYRLRNDLFSFIFQSTNLMSEFTVLENILMAAKYEADKTDRVIAKIHELLNETRLEPDILNRKPHEISGGQKQRIAFIRALSSQFKILMADEPTGNLDMQNSHALFQLLRKHIVQENKAAVIVTHHLELAKEYGDYIVWFSKRKNETFARPFAQDAAEFNQISAK